MFRGVPVFLVLAHAKQKSFFRDWPLSTGGGGPEIKRGWAIIFVDVKRGGSRKTMLFINIGGGSSIIMLQFY